MNIVRQYTQGDASDLYGIYSQLMACSTGLRNDTALACMLASRCVGQGSMPVWLGLDVIQFYGLLEVYFPGSILPLPDDTACDDELERSDEQLELYELLMAHKADSKPDTHWMAKIVTAGCMGGNHLWQDLGLWARQDLTQLMEVTFPALAQRNDKNMKWKKFLYKQLCIQEGIYTCRSPSCEVCVEYKECFSLE